MERAQNLNPNHYARRYNLHFQILFSFNIFHLVLAAAVGSSSFFFSFSFPFGCGGGVGVGWLARGVTNTFSLTLAMKREDMNSDTIANTINNPCMMMANPCINLIQSKPCHVAYWHLPNCATNPNEMVACDEDWRGGCWWIESCGCFVDGGGCNLCWLGDLIVSKGWSTD